VLDLTTLLALSIVALILGAGIGLLLLNRGWGIAALKGLMASFLGGLLFLHLLPHAYALLGPWSLLWMAAGFLAVILPERLGSHHDHGGRIFTAEILWIGLIIHQLTDGVGLAMASHQGASGWHLVLVVLAHRIPVAAVVIWLFTRQSRQREGWLRIGAMALATIAGAVFWETLSPLFSSQIVNGLYAFIAGSFLHLLTHDFIDHHAHRDLDRRGEFMAFMLGIALLIGAETLIHTDLTLTGSDPAVTAVAHDGHDHGDSSAGQLMSAHAGAGAFIDAFVALVRETAPYLLLGLVISGILHRYMPASPIGWLQRGGPLTQSAKGMAFGLPLPICSCGVLPLFLGLSRKGVPPACLVAFLIATPELGVDSFLLSVKLLGLEFSVVRLIIAIVLPLVIAMIAIRFLPDRPIEQEPVKSCCKKGGDVAAQPKAWWRFAFVDLVDDIFPFVVFGLTIAAVAQVIWPASSFGDLVGQWDVLLLGALGIPFYVCASASVPFALVLLQQGFSVGAVVVFLFAGPATNVATILTVNKAFGPGTGMKLALTSFLVAIATGFLINAVYDPGQLDIIDLHAHGWTFINAAGTIAIVALGIAGLYRHGPLHWLSTVLGMIPGMTHHPTATEEPTENPETEVPAVPN